MNPLVIMTSSSLKEWSTQTPCSGERTPSLAERTPSSGKKMPRSGEHGHLCCSWHVMV